jgi:hypothetical protein
MIVTVAKYVNARISCPQMTAENPFYLIPGDRIEVHSVHTGTSIDGNAIWYKDAEGYYYWSGGFAEKGLGLELFSPAIELDTMDYEFQLAFLTSLLSEYIALYDDKNYTSLGVGEISDNSVGIIISLPPGTPLENYSHVVREIVYKGYKVPIQIDNQSKFRPTMAMYRDKNIPLVMGGTLENMVSGAVGTRGVKVLHGKKEAVLTCFHVGCYNLMEEEIKTYDNRIINIRLPASKSSSEVPAMYGRVIAGRVGGFYDYSLVSIPTSDKISGSLLKDAAPDSSYTSQEISALRKGAKFYSYGALTGKRSGTLMYVYPASSYTTIEYDFIGDTRINGLLQTSKISEEGDSGGVVVDAYNKVVGIIIASSEDYSLVMPFFRLLNIHTLKLLP